MNLKRDLKIKKIDVKKINYTKPEKFFEKYHNIEYSALLTGKGLSDISRFSFIGVFPHSIIQQKGKSCEIKFSSGIEKIKGDFFSNLKEILELINFSEFEYPVSLCGGIGFISYEALHEIEKIEKKTVDNFAFPIFQMVFYNRYFVFDHENKECFEINIDYSKESLFDKKIESESDFEVSNVKLESLAEEYIEKVKKIQDYIVEGDVYEVNLTQQISGDFSGNSFELFKKLYSINKAPYSAYLNFGENQIVCNSPESFLFCEDKKVVTRPIKGTISRGISEKEDKKNREILWNSKKDQAELFMIVDLLRNDIGKVCEFGSVDVKNAKRLEAYNNVYHLVSIIEGRLKKNIDHSELIKATFPGGSITGCPKIRCMEIIEEIETFSRNLYTGTIFILNKNYFNSNIVIRSAVIQKGKIFMNSGGAITIDSNPKDEYDEIIHKIKNLLESGGYDYGRLLL